MGRLPGLPQTRGVVYVLPCCIGQTSRLRHAEASSEASLMVVPSRAMGKRLGVAEHTVLQLGNAPLILPHV